MQWRLKLLVDPSLIKDGAADLPAEVDSLLEPHRERLISYAAPKT